MFTFRYRRTLQASFLMYFNFLRVIFKESLTSLHAVILGYQKGKKTCIGAEMSSITSRYKKLSPEVNILTDEDSIPHQ